MNVSFGQAPEKYDRSTWRGILGLIAQAFARVQNWQRIETSTTLDFVAPGGVPGVTDQNVTLAGAEFGDTVLVGCSITTPVIDKAKRKVLSFLSNSNNRLNIGKYDLSVIFLITLLLEKSNFSSTSK